MSYRSILPRVTAPTTVTRCYHALSGVDLSSDAANVGLHRAASARNMYRPRGDGSDCVMTRPGFRRIGEFTPSGSLNGLHRAPLSGGERVLAHVKNALWLWPDFPADFDAQTAVCLCTDLNDGPSVSFFSGNYLYLLDGLHYRRYDGSTLSEVSAAATVPTTVIGRGAAGGGTAHQPPNLLTGSRVNSFLADGSSTVYALDTDGLDADGTVAVTHDGAALTSGWTVDRAAGTVTFDVAPTAPTTPGVDNLTVAFVKTVDGALASVTGNTLCAAFDNRFFLAGAPAHPARTVNCMAGDPCYFPDSAWVEAGGDAEPVRALLTVRDGLFTLKDSRVYRQAGADSDSAVLARVYPVSGGSEYGGCVAARTAVNFYDDPVFLTPGGLWGIDRLSGAVSERTVGRRSSRIDPALTAESGLSAATAAEWRDYLVLQVGAALYLADSRAVSGGEYEWYCWDGIGIYDAQGVFHAATAVAAVGDCLCFGTDNGVICRFNTDRTGADGGLTEAAYSDDGTRAIEAEWAFALDDFGLPQLEKTLLSRGCVLHAHSAAHTAVQVAVRTEGSHETAAGTLRAGRFDFGALDFGEWSFATTGETLLGLKLRARRFCRLQVILSCSEAGKPFGIYSLTLTARRAALLRR